VDHARTHRDCPGWPASRLNAVNDPRLAAYPSRRGDFLERYVANPGFGQALEREVVLAPIRLAVREWPGHRGPLLITEPGALPDPSRLAPRWRILSLTPRPNIPLHVRAWDVLGVLDQFGFLRPVLLGGLPALLLGAWFPHRVAGLVLIDPVLSSNEPELVDCQPDLAALRARLACPVLDMRLPPDHAMLESFLASAC
jgi:hypothetical protein